MDFYDVVKIRHSLRNYDPNRKVPREVIERILNAGRLAPSAVNNQPWRFIVTDSEKALKDVHSCYHASWFQDAPNVLIVAGDYDKAWVRGDGYNSLETDLAIAMDHIILAAANEGVGTCWIAAFNPFALRKVLKLKASEQVFTITPLGYPKEGFKDDKRRSRKPLDDVAEWI
ncbi:MAG: nitroreductase [Spirochaetes bacterium]|nr:MAG: nitroreductase [Spirochaetota bacterium]